jgi:hypothetical protein
MAMCVKEERISIFKYWLKYTIIYLILITTICSCEKEIPLNFPENEKFLVIEGWIEQGKGAKVILTYSASFNEAIDSSNLRNYVSTKAKVTVYHDGNSEILTLKPNENFFPPLYYFGSSIKGNLNSQYSIKVEDAGKIYEASTTIPDLVYPDSVWFERYRDYDTLGLLWIEISDNFYNENYYRTLVKRIGKDKNFVPTLTSTFSDKLFNGQKIRLSLSKGNSNILDIGGSRFFEANDTLVLKFCSLDKAHYDFWQSIQNSLITSANPFSSNKTEIKSNIVDGFGVWGGYAAVYDTLITK